MLLRKPISIAITSIGAIGMVAVGLFVGTAFASDSMGKLATYDTNEDGLTFGPGMGVAPDDAPDLILAIGDNGREGYIRFADLNSAAPSTPEEALATQARPGSVSQVLDVYLSDGKTKIDTFTILGGDASTEATK